MSIRLPPLPSLRDLVRLYKLKAVKQLSQNFLMDLRLTDKIVRAAGPLENHYVCEVGPGPGGITRSILKRKPKRLVVVEKDPRFLPTLELLQEVSYGAVDMRVEIGDIRSFNLEAAFEGCQKKDWERGLQHINLIGNLPFSVSTILLVEWLKSISERKSAWVYGRASMTLTFQKEVAERMTANVTEKQRCRLSVITQLYTDPNYVFTIPGAAFVPKPDVDVGVVTLYPKRFPLVATLPFDQVEKVIRAIFNMRQKYCLRGASNLFPKEEREELTSKLFHLADVDPHARPFELSNEEFARLCYAHNAICENRADLLRFDYRAPKYLTAAVNG